MCTLTWWREAAGTYEVFFNRDEKKTRALAEPPRLHQREGVTFLAPIDPEGGGTWMLVNQLGVVVCLLNRWQETAAMKPARSRGQLVLEMGSLENVPAIEERLRAEDLSATRPFAMVGFDAVGERAWTWNGAELTVRHKPAMPMCSSSYHYAEVALARERRFHELRCARTHRQGLLEHFHADTDEGPTAFTARMLRSDAQTMSRTRVRVSPEGASCVYLEEQRDLAGEPRVFESAI